VIFLGTASCIPSATRGVSCAALRYEGKTWLFDGGEGSQVQVQKSPLVHPGKVDAIFVSHVHGDHTFGLPGLLCIIGQNQENNRPIHIYGPQGLALYLRTSLQLSVSRVAAKYIVHELRNVPLITPPGSANYTFSHQLDTIFFGPTHAAEQAFPGNEHFGEIGRYDIEPNDDLTWTIQVPESSLIVKAAPMVHGVPCLGYVVIEPNKPGKIHAQLVGPIVDRNYDALKAKGIKHPKKVFQVLKNMRSGQSMTFPDGTKLYRDDVVEPDRRGRVVVFCGDTCDASRLLPLIGNTQPDLVIHEATNAHLLPYDNHIDPRQVAKHTAAHGHSTPEMAAYFAYKARAKRLVLTHFSPRYKGDASINALAVMHKIEQAALRAWYTLSNSTQQQVNYSVVAAWDLLFLPIPSTTFQNFKEENKRTLSDDDASNSNNTVLSSSSSSSSRKKRTNRPPTNNKKKELARSSSSSSSASTTL